ncbi:DNA-directed RNA polymerase II core subunit [Basidiobolus ranarum]|uniref:DNA-directed RNA polymerase II core subunit n=1 Tax=Basidiobolus ranarum TaxID=34480 RepID=A0ABR2W5B6_9FUNG
MNAPDRFELFILPEGVKKVSVEPDTKIPNAATITIQKEDHTLANILRFQLLKDPRVLFAGYKAPHPLEHLFYLKIQTTPETTPVAALSDAINELIGEYGTIRQRFEYDLTRARAEQEARTAGGADFVDMHTGMDTETADLDF